MNLERDHFTENIKEGWLWEGKPREDQELHVMYETFLVVEGHATAGAIGYANSPTAVSYIAPSIQAQYLCLIGGEQERKENWIGETWEPHCLESVDATDVAGDDW